MISERAMNEIMTERDKMKTQTEMMKISSTKMISNAFTVIIFVIQRSNADIKHLAMSQKNDKQIIKNTL